MIKIGAILKRKREEKRLSQQEVADFLEISQKTYSNFESDKSEPRISQIFVLGSLLDFDVIALLKSRGIWKDDMESPPPIIY